MAALTPIDWQSEEAGEQIVRDLHQTGFCVLHNHSVNWQLVDSLRQFWRVWFEDCRVKESYRHDYTQAGWFGRHHAEKPRSAGGRRDDKEYFQIFGDTIDQAPTTLRGMVRAHFKEMNAFALELAATIDAHAPEKWDLHKAIAESPATMLRILYYPSLSDEEIGKIHEDSIEDCRAAAHVDLNLFTMIPCNAEPGLQLLTQEGEWEYVPHSHEYLVVNAGDMMQYMTEDYIVGAQHRVVTPADHARARMSLPFFVHPRPEVEITEGLTAESFLQQRLRQLGVA